MQMLSGYGSSNSSFDHRRIIQAHIGGNLTLTTSCLLTMLATTLKQIYANKEKPINTVWAMFTL